MILVLCFCGIVSHAQSLAEYRQIADPVEPGQEDNHRDAGYLSASNTVHAGGRADYLAGRAVALRPGFAARFGSVFRASVGEVPDDLAAEGRLHLSAKAFPNPVVDQVRIEYVLPRTARARHSVTDLQGRVLRSWGGAEAEKAGPHSLRLNTGFWLEGVYIYRIEAGAESRTIRLVK
ncbi:T9SS type A sorting domain-containing protein [Larkinella soli]|uniref:T9SS type A sorting domain-containing protein n=1 Tax=Larkinella soli TaxID=1770527 RepID=UPI0013E3F133|nr:T9SS type A sorting domain-containing protein [Larkinella soli]